MRLCGSWLRLLGSATSELQGTRWVPVPGLGSSCIIVRKSVFFLLLAGNDSGSELLAGRWAVQHNAVMLRPCSSASSVQAEQAQRQIQKEMEETKRYSFLSPAPSPSRF